MIGGVVGGVIGLFVGVPGLGAAWGASAGAALFGVGTAVEDICQKARLEWREKPLQDQRMVGFHRVEHDQSDGWDRKGYEADIQSTTLGTYWEPVVVYYNAVTGKVEREQ